MLIKPVPARLLAATERPAVWAARTGKAQRFDRTMRVSWLSPFERAFKVPRSPVIAAGKTSGRWGRSAVRGQLLSACRTQMNAAFHFPAASAFSFLVASFLKTRIIVLVSSMTVNWRTVRARSIRRLAALALTWLHAETRAQLISRRLAQTCPIDYSPDPLYLLFP